VQPVGPDGKPDADLQIAVDSCRCGHGPVVLINSDGKGRELIGDPKSPARYFVIGWWTSDHYGPTSRTYRQRQQRPRCPLPRASRRRGLGKDEAVVLATAT
jgi:hypothetical protein